MHILGASVVIQRIRVTPKIDHVNLGHNSLGDRGLSVIIDYLCQPENDVPVEELNLNNCGIGDSGLFVLTRYVKHNDTLRRLYLMGVITYRIAQVYSSLI
jgi:Ran GTPase-activating protein (RanGAP) involved in mRNA processing and transport